MVLGFLRKLWYESMSKQFVPTEEDIASTKQLAERLKGETDAETLSNILEWQEKNVAYWWERFLFDAPLKILIPMGGIVLFILFMPILLILMILNKILFLIVSAIVSIFYIFFTFSQMLGKIYYLFIGAPIVYYSILIIFNVKPLHSLLPYTYFYVSCLFIFLFVIFYLYFRYLKVTKSSFYEIFNDTFKSTLPINKIIKYRLAVCRDYAKLTATFLANLYPDNKIYFFTFTGHVAAGVELNNKTYVLDQKLPILEKEAWLINWGKKEAKVFELIRRDDKISIKLVGKISTKRNLRSTKDFKSMLKDFVKEVDKAIRNGQSSIEFTLKNMALLFDISDSVVRNSLLRKIELILQEFVSNVSKIKSIDVMKKNSDLLLRISLVS